KNLAGGSICMSMRSPKPARRLIDAAADHLVDCALVDGHTDVLLELSDILLENLLGDGPAQYFVSALHLFRRRIELGLGHIDDPVDDPVDTVGRIGHSGLALA